MAVIHKSRSKKNFACGKISVGLANHTRPGLLENKHITIKIPVDENTDMIVSFTRKEIEEINDTISSYGKEIW